MAQQGFPTSEPFSEQKAGVKANFLLFTDDGYPPYAHHDRRRMEKTVKERAKVVAALRAGHDRGLEELPRRPGARATR